MAEEQKVSMTPQEKKLLKANSEVVIAAKLIKEMHERWLLSGLGEVPEDGTLGAIPM